MEEITLNGKTYVLKEQDNIIYNRFNIHPMGKILQLLKGEMNLPSADYPISEREAVAGEEIGVMDTSNIFMVIAKTERAKLILRYFVEKDGKRERIPKLTFDAGKSSFSTEYLVSALKLFEQSDESFISIQTGQQFPLRMENTDWAFILAPRVLDDNGTKFREND